MSDPSHSQSSPKREKGLLERLSWLLLREPEDREQLQEILQQAHERNLLDAEALSMIEGVMQVSELVARDIMIPRVRMDMINVEDDLKDVLSFAVERTHSRFPVYERNKDNVIGVLLAKDLLRMQQGLGGTLREMLRPAVYIPETKKLNFLLHDFRVNRNHIALVVDEHGGVSGLVTIEDVLEQIVGDIEDEYDFDTDADNIIGLHGSDAGSESGAYRVKAITELSQFDEVFGTTYSNEQAHTVGGLLTEHLGRIPRRGEVILIPPMKFEVLKAHARQVLLVKVRHLSSQELNIQNKTSEHVPSGNPA
ncbi:MAG: transporter associated domain-containing protein [Limnobacter sp.]|nr:transporter associated domain-containing protein [Limnobacter sp.]